MHFNYRKKGRMQNIASILPESEMNGREEVDFNRFRKTILSFIGYSE